MRHALWLVVLAGCWGRTSEPKATPPRVDRGPTVKLAIASGVEVRVVELSRAGTKVLYRVTVPVVVDQLAWIGAEPVAMLQEPASMTCGLWAESEDEALRQRADEECAEAEPDGAIGLVTPQGFRRFDRLPLAIWKVERRKPEDLCEQRCFHMVVTKAGEIWQGYCDGDWSEHPGAQQIGCDRTYARIDQRQGISELKDSKFRYQHFEHPLPKLAVPPTVKVSATEVDSHFQNTLRCVHAGKTYVYPKENEPQGAFNDEGLQWLATEPPIFQITENYSEYGGRDVIFEGCIEQSLDQVVAGPDDLVAVFDREELYVIHRGVLLGKTVGGQAVAFAPRPGH